MITVSGESLVAGRWQLGGGQGFRAENRLSQVDDGLNEVTFYDVSPTQTNQAVEKAEADFRAFITLPLQNRAGFMQLVATKLELHAEELAKIANRETGLPMPRLIGEVGRTVGQLRYLAEQLSAGRFAGSFRDVALPDRTPLPRPELRSSLQGVGSVAVFGASNFPFAFSVAGGDTASAWAAGCPVVVKGHPGHPASSEAVARLIDQAIEETHGLRGVFSLLVGKGHDVGAGLVAHPDLRGVGFTGSRFGGLALQTIALNRDVPIPFFAEMSSVNPSLIHPSSIADQAKELGTKFAASIALGAGQFCTNPGVILLVGSPQAEDFIGSLRDALKSIPAAPMLNGSIEENYVMMSDRLSGIAGVTTVLHPAGPGYCGLYRAAAASVRQHPAVLDEVFGPSSLLVECSTFEEAIDIINQMDGQLTASLHAAQESLSDCEDAIWALSQRAGRVLLNQFPTGVEVCDAMVHGGPYPSTSDGKSTSVGFRSVERWQRAVCFQNFPAV